MAAFSRGFSPASLVWELPGRLPEAYETLAAPPGGKYNGPMRLRTALAGGRLAPLEQVLLQVGAANVWRLAEPLGLGGITIGGDPARLLLAGGDIGLPALAGAYSVFANGGDLAGQRLAPGGALQPAAVLSVGDFQGRRLVEPARPERQALLSAGLSYLVHHVLSDEPARWPTLGYPNPLEIGRPAGALTALADGGKQAWTVGYTRQLLAVTWIGLPSGAPAGLSLDRRASAGLWHGLMQQAHRELPVLAWEVPPGISTVEVCDPSGFLPTAACPVRTSEIFLAGNEPTGADTLYRTFQINRETGLLATVFTPPEMVDSRTFLVLPADAQAWGRQAGLPLPPTAYDRIQPPAPLKDVRITSPALFSTVAGKLNLTGTAAGTNFSSYRVQAGEGLNPQAWLNIGQGESPVQDGLLATWDTQGRNGLFALRLQVVRSDNTVETAILQVTVDNTPPVVRLASPPPGRQPAPSGSAGLILRAEASDTVGLERVEFWLDGQRVGQAVAPPYVVLHQPAKGAHTLIAIAYDLAGNKTESLPVTFEIE